MTDTEILDWINDHAIELGLTPDWQGRDPETGRLMFQKTDIRRRVLKLAEREAPNNGDEERPASAKSLAPKTT